MSGTEPIKIREKRHRHATEQGGSGKGRQGPVREAANEAAECGAIKAITTAGLLKSAQKPLLFAFNGYFFGVIVS
jgi:hypothetical protein